MEVARDGASAKLGKRDTEPFSMVGVTWTDPSARVTGTVEVRTKDASSGKWSDWQSLDGDAGEREDGATRGGTDPLWVGPSKGVEVRATAGGQVTKLPKGLRLDMIDPGTGKVSGMEPAAYALPAEPADETPSPSADETPATEDPVAPQPSAAPSTPEATPSTSSEAPAPDGPPTAEAPRSAPQSAPSAGPPSTAPRPVITPRSGWGADETLSPEAPTYLPGGTVKAVTVHHTAGSNNYTCAQAPEVIRGVYAYHLGKTWKDIGYNFLVDKCGTIYEGRKGGVDRPVVGAHAYGFNNETTGISILGEYTKTAPSQAALQSVARIAAWKLGQYGVSPTGTTVLTAGAAGSSASKGSWQAGAKLTFNTIHGHRDGYATECPGNLVYNQLATVRDLAGGSVTGLAVTSLTGVGVSGSTYYTKAAVTVNWKATTPPAFISKYELLVDGQPVATTSGTVTTAGTKLSPGSHRLQVRATHVSGKTTLSTAATVVGDVTAPTFTSGPTPGLRSGSVSASAVPMTLSWKASDDAALKEVRLTAPVAKTYGPTITSAPHTARLSAATTWSMTAFDRANNRGNVSVGSTPVILQETSATRTGSWTSKSSSSYFGGKSYTSSAKNASLSWTFTSRSAAVVVSRAATSGQMYVYVDGVKTHTVDLKSATTKYREAIWTKNWATSGKHTIKIVVVGTTGRPAVTVDGLIHLK
ncbi:N-acetylmuramoyl-L-alanine amidase [Streptomyces sp. NPDC004609]|uniref:peptidoglycan recognition protein family protein n=1 Tax=Streptomyces sp. NPDC004609 TaxID=3364704 RepID=UPI0036BF37BF